MVVLHQKQEVFAVHVELESGTITGGGSGDLLFEDAVDNENGGKFLDSSTQMQDFES